MAEDIKSKISSTGFPYLFHATGEENKPLKISVIISIIVHLLLFWIVFPEVSEKKPEEDSAKNKIVYLHPYKIYQPPKPPKKGSPVVKKREKKIIPIPDPTPDDPEPVSPALTDIPPWAVESDEVGDYEFGYPEAPPGGPEGGLVFRPGNDVTPPVIIKKILPIFPEEAKRAKIESKVIAEAIIDKNGIPRSVKLISITDDRLGFGKAVIEAFKQWRFQPATKNGKPVAVLIHYIVDFYFPKDSKS
jgi:TonB family protein